MWKQPDYVVERICADRSLVLAAAHTATKHQISMRDALILETAATAGCAELLTEDLANGSTLRGMTIVNPFLVG